MDVIIRYPANTRRFSAERIRRTHSSCIPKPIRRNESSFPVLSFWRRRWQSDGSPYLRRKFFRNHNKRLPGYRNLFLGSKKSPGFPRRNIFPHSRTWESHTKYRSSRGLRRIRKYCRIRCLRAFGRGCRARRTIGNRNYGIRSIPRLNPWSLRHAHLHPQEMGGFFHNSVRILRRDIPIGRFCQLRRRLSNGNSLSECFFRKSPR